MKLRALQFTTKCWYLGDSTNQGKCDDTTHDIEVAQDGPGYLCRHRKSGKVYFVPYALAVGELAEEKPAEDEPPGPFMAAAMKAAEQGAKMDGEAYVVPIDMTPEAEEKTEPPLVAPEVKRESAPRGKVRSRIVAPQE